MRARHVILVGTALTGAALTALAGCGSGADKPAPAPASAAAPSASVDPDASIDPGTDPGTLDATSAYLSALGKLDRKLVGDTGTALANGQQVCVDMEERRSDAEQARNVATRFAVDAAQAQKILALTKANLCLQ